MISRNTLLAFVVGFALAWWNFASKPDATPLDDRPVLQWVARLAKFGLWVALAAEPPPDDRQIARAVSPDSVNHNRGW